jgi:HTH-type transcriptional regulator/antitoxin HipB
MQTDQNKDLITLDQILNQKYGERGAVKREQWEQEFEVFRLSVLLKQDSGKQDVYLK